MRLSFVRRWLGWFARWSPAARVAAVFFALSVLWIAASDRAARVLATDLDQLTTVQTYKGWAFMFGATLLLYALVRREFRRRVEAEDRGRVLADREDLVHRAQRMEAVGRLAGGIAHDFNNQMTVVSGCAALLLEDLPADDPRRADVQEIREAAARATDLTNQLLAFSRRQVLRPRVMEPGEMIPRMETMLRRVIGEDIELSVVVAAGAGYVEVDPVRLEQVVMNLIVNARDAMPDGGRIDIHIARVDLDPDFAEGFAYPVEPGPYVRLRVSDTGAGMDAETRAHVFEPFFTTKARGEGTGLGLSSVYGIVKQSGGYIWVDSAPGAGATFDVYLPRVEAVDDADVAGERADDADPAPGGRETVLVAEDETPVRRLLARVLREGGYRVIEARDGKAALELAEAHPDPIDLVVTDVVMPRMGGAELVRELAARRPQVRTMYVSGYADEEVRHRLADDGSPAFVEKPIDPAALLRRVRQVLDDPVRA